MHDFYARLIRSQFSQGRRRWRYVGNLIVSMSRLYSDDVYVDTSRASFRSGLTQPSQMGNFRHQSIRTTERGGEKDVDRERERDLRDKEGQERLRNVSLCCIFCWFSLMSGFSSPINTTVSV